MRSFFLLIAFAISCMGAWAQVYRPRLGETDLKLDVEGKGVIFIKLYGSEAPKTVGQIEQLVKSGFYNTQRFHRVDRSPKPYLVQIGDPASKAGDLADPSMGTGGSGAHIPYENTGHQNVEGAVGLARSVDNPDSGDSQFYILLGAAKFLDGHYTVFGQVVSGMDVVQRIERGDRVTSATIVSG